MLRKIIFTRSLSFSFIYKEKLQKLKLKLPALRNEYMLSLSLVVKFLTKIDPALVSMTGVFVFVYRHFGQISDYLISRPVCFLILLWLKIHRTFSLFLSTFLWSQLTLYSCRKGNEPSKSAHLSNWSKKGWWSTFGEGQSTQSMEQILHSMVNRNVVLSLWRSGKI